MLLFLLSIDDIIKNKNVPFPGIQVKVVNSYAAASLFVSVSFANKLDFPTLGNPINATLASPDLATANPSPGPLDALPPSGFRSCLRSLQSLAFRRPKCELVALFFCVIFISCSISLIFSRIPMLKLEFIEKITQCKFEDGTGQTGKSWKESKSGS